LLRPRGQGLHRQGGLVGGFRLSESLPDLRARAPAQCVRDTTPQKERGPEQSDPIVDPMSLIQEIDLDLARVLLLVLCSGWLPVRRDAAHDGHALPRSFAAGEFSSHSRHATQYRARTYSPLVGSLAPRACVCHTTSHALAHRSPVRRPPEPWLPRWTTTALSPRSWRTARR
jgi:hypothetical protein